MNGRLRGHNMTSASLLAAVLVSITAPVLAQQQAPLGPPTQEDALKRQVLGFEIALKNAIIKAGGNVADWARKIDPSIVLTFVAQPEVRAVPLLDNSLVFHVDVAELGVSSALLVLKGDVFGPEPRQGNPATRVGGTGTAPDSKVGAPMMSPSQYMTEQVREALVDAILDSPQMLPLLTTGQTLTVACNPVDVLVNNPIYQNRSKKLVLQIKGEDLVAMREGKLTREQARDRIIERRF